MGAGIRTRVVDALDSGSHPAATNRLGDFISSPRVIVISLLAIVVGVLSAFVALVLLRMIGFFTANLEATPIYGLWECGLDAY